MSDLQSYNLRPLWDAIIEMYGAIRRVCEENNIRFYVTGGTALGAARHGGFIPWDDDFDLIMPRQDYRRFVDVVSHKLPDCYQATDFHSNEMSYGFSGMFGKVYETRSEIVQRVERESNLCLPQGVFIDIIPIDGMPKCAIPFYLWALNRSAWRHAGETTPNLVKKVFWRFMTFFFGIPKRGKEFAFEFEQWLMRYDFDKCGAAWDYNGIGRMLKKRAMDPRLDFGEPVWMKFENTQVPMPHSWEKFLTVIFGDWRTLPPEEKRVPSHQVL